MTSGPNANPARAGSAGRNVALYPWFKLLQNLVFWQAIWFLFFQSRLSAAEAVLLYAIYDIATTAFEVPSGYMSDRLGRRITVIAAAVAGVLGAGLIAVGGGFLVFAFAQVLLGVSAAFSSGTDSALLYESLAQDGKADQIEAAENRAWRFSLVGLAVSAVTGGLLAQVSFAAAFGAGAVAMGGALLVALRFVEPQRQQTVHSGHGLAEHWRMFRQAMGDSVLVWLFALSVLMYGFSHLPFVFGQPFIAEALAQRGWQAEAPLVSGVVTALMMIVSAVASLFATGLRRKIGLAAILLLAFAIQIGLIATLALSSSMLAIAVLLLRMVPNSLSRPFIVARMQPLLSDAGRATFLSLQSFAGRLLFAASLLVVSGNAPDGTVLAQADISRILGWYTAGGCVLFVALALSVTRARINSPL